MSGQSNAGANGAALERLIQSTQAFRPYVELGKNGRKTLKDIGLSAAPGLVGGKPFYSLRTTVDGLHSIYGVNWTVDVFVWHPTKMANGFVMECKWQQVGGSTDDKLPFSVLSLDHLKTSCGVEVSALMLDAAGARECVKDWVERECNARDIRFFRQGSVFARWADKNL
jgi:PD-(D/E)XK nuclease superfamily domain